MKSRSPAFKRSLPRNQGASNARSPFAGSRAAGRPDTTELLKFKFLPGTTNRTQLVLKEIFATEQRYADNWKRHTTQMTPTRLTDTFNSSAFYPSASGFQPPTMHSTTPRPMNLSSKIEENLQLLAPRRHSRLDSTPARPMQTYSPSPYGRLDYFSGRGSFYY